MAVGGFSQAGLSDAEAAARLDAEGPNELPRQVRRTLPRILIDVLREPMLALLLGAGCVYLLLGDLQEALILVAFAGLSILITVVQEQRTERALAALRDLTSPRALVIRGGVRQRIAGRDVVRGDLVVLGEGDRVPADGWLATCEGLSADESLLTGESVPVRKQAATMGPPEAAARPGGDDQPFAFAGTLVVRGSGLLVVTATGAASHIGRIGLLLATVETAAPRLQRQTRRLVLWFAAVGAIVSLLAVLLFGLLRGSWLEAALAGIALGMSMLPEEFPVVLTIFMAMGATRLSRQRVLTRRAAAIETLGSATVLCTDKTGTLTQNRMRIAELRLPDGRALEHRDGEALALDDEFHLLAELGILASASQAVDPMDIAFHELGDDHAPATVRSRQQAGWALQHHYPLEPALLAMTHVWHDGSADGARLIAAKGAPEAIAGLCALTGAARADFDRSLDAMARRGLRVLGVAEARWEGASLPESPRAFTFRFRGLVGLADPLRPEVPAAVRQCAAAGVRVIMITGDYPETARAIAAQAGIAADDVVTGDELAGLDEAALARRLAGVGVCARIMPRQKLRIVEALKAAGEVVAMTGDGVNDAPALKAADIGVAMGGRGTDVAREAAAIVLLDDDFASIVAAMRLGRRIYDNLRKAMAFIIAAHVPIAGLALLPLVAGMPLLLGPVHIAFLEMIIDPVSSLAFEAEVEERDVMARPPRRPDAQLFSGAIVGWSAVQGGVVLALVAGLAMLLWGQGVADSQVRAATFLALVSGLVVLVLLNRRFGQSLGAAVGGPNRALAAVLTVVVSLMLGAQLLPPLAGLFDFTPVSARQALAIAGGAITALMLLERLKRRWSPALST